MKKPFEPLFNTPQDDISKEEKNKLQANGFAGCLDQEMHDTAKKDIIWEAEQVAKSHGIYLEFNRAIKGGDKQWMFMIRLSNPGGGPINRQQWLLLDELAEKYTKNPEGVPSIRLTTRQAIQFHWISKEGVLDIVKTMAENGMRSLNACGDNTRNVMGCPMDYFNDVFQSQDIAQQLGSYFQLPLDPFIKVFAINPETLEQPTESFQYGPQLLNRKFKIAVATAHRDAESDQLTPDNCIEALTNDVGIVPLIENNKIKRMQIYVGGGQGERNGKPAIATLAKPLCIVTKEQLIPVMDAIVATHQDIGDRKNRHWARLKYVIQKMGVEWFRDQVQSRLDITLTPPQVDYDYGARDLHFGWQQQPTNKLWSYGLFIENGRIIDDSPNGKLKTMIRELVKKYDPLLFVTANQDLIFSNISEDQKANFEADLAEYGYGQRNGKTYSQLRLRSGACVGRDTCRLTYTDSEKFEPFLIDELEKLGWSDMEESIGITGCERQCFRPATKTIGLVGSGLNRYQFKLMGSEDGRFQGVPVIGDNPDEMYLRSIDREQVPVVIDSLFKFYKTNAEANETLGAFHRRIGMQKIIDHLKSDPATQSLMEKPFNTDCVLI